MLKVWKLSLDMPVRHTGGAEVQLPSLLMLALDEGKWSTSHVSGFTPLEKSPTTHSIGNFVGPRFGPDILKKRHIFCETQTVQPLA